MISRYDQKELSSIWSDQQKFSFYLQVELALLEALELCDYAQKGQARKIRESVKINIERIKEIEAKVHHDVIAFCSSITEQVDAETARFFHYGVTSSDIIDTATNLQVRKSLDLIFHSFKALLHSLKEDRKSVV